MEAETIQKLTKVLTNHSDVLKQQRYLIDQLRGKVDLLEKKMKYYEGGIG